MTVRERVERCRAGVEPTLVMRLKSGWFCLNELQPVTGHIAYGVLYSDTLAQGYHSLSTQDRAQWGIDCGICADVLMEVLGAVRANYETWGNVDPTLHTHITARFATEPTSLRSQTPREAYDWKTGRVLDFQSVEVLKLMSDLRQSFERRT